MMFRFIFRFVFVISLLLVSSITQAQNNALMRFHYGYLDLLGDADRIYLFKNISNRPIMLDRYRRYNPGVSAGWSSLLKPGNWSAIIVKFSPFTLSCKMKNQSGNYQRICCKHVLKIRPIQKFTSQNKTSGSFWIAENVPYKIMKKRVKGRGFYLDFVIANTAKQ